MRDRWGDRQHQMIKFDEWNGMEWKSDQPITGYLSFLAARPVLEWGEIRVSQWEIRSRPLSQSSMSATDVSEWASSQPKLIQEAVLCSLDFREKSTYILFKIFDAWATSEAHRLIKIQATSCECLFCSNHAQVSSPRGEILSILRLRAARAASEKRKRLARSTNFWPVIKAATSSPHLTPECRFRPLRRHGTDGCRLVSERLGWPFYRVQKPRGKSQLILGFLFLIHTHFIYYFLNPWIFPQVLNKQYVAKLEEVGELQGKCMKEISHQRYRIGVMKNTLKK